MFFSFGFMSSANAQFTGMVQVTCTNGTFTVGWDNENQYFAGRGNIAALYCDIIQHTGYVSDNLTDPTLRYFGGVLPQDIPSATVETQTQVSQETSTSVSESATPTSSSDSSTSSTPAVETGTTQTVLDTVTATSDSQTVNSESVETQTLTSETSTLTSQPETPTSQVEVPLPTPDPVVETTPVVVPVPQPVVQPNPEISPIPVEPTVPSDSSTVVEDPVIEIPVEEVLNKPTVEEQQPVEEQPESPVEEEQPQNPDDSSPEEQPSPTPQPEPEPVVIPEPTSQPDTSYEPPMVTLDNGVILSQEVAEQVELLQNPTELLSELFTNPVAALAALGSVGADMSPEARKKAKKAVVQAVVVGSIITQAAGAAAYRRKP